MLCIRWSRESRQHLAVLSEYSKSITSTSPVGGAVEMFVNSYTSGCSGSRLKGLAWKPVVRCCSYVCRASARSQTLLSEAHASVASDLSRTVPLNRRRFWFWVAVTGCREPELSRSAASRQLASRLLPSCRREGFLPDVSCLLFRSFLSVQNWNLFMISFIPDCCLDVLFTLNNSLPSPCAQKGRAAFSFQS